LQFFNFTVSLPHVIATFLFGYLLGSIPFGLILTRLAGTDDIRNVGSGNIGATNVLRTGRKGLAVATLVGDMLKGTAAVLLVNWSTGSEVPEYGLVAGAGAVFGHVYPVWLKFKGGKGVATYIGVLLGVDWRAALAFCAVWLGVALATRYSSLSALIAALATPVGLLITGDIATGLLAGLMSALLIFKHRANIRRLTAGEEPRIGAKA